jgi:hypothetical protein
MTSDHALEKFRVRTRELSSLRWGYMMLYDVILCYIMFYFVILCYMMLYYVVLCYMLDYFILFHIIS